jgi:hypothetical protein
MPVNADEWSHSIVTYNGGYSHTVAGVKFKKGIPKPVKSLALRNRLTGEPGFHFLDVKKPGNKSASPLVTQPKASGKKVKKKKILKKKPDSSVVKVSNGGNEADE